MAPETTGLHVNLSDETIRLGPLVVRFLVTGDYSTGGVAAFELSVPAAQHLAAPAQSHDHYEETIYGIAGVLTWTVDGSGRGRHSAFRAVPFTGSTTTADRT
jgi:quercetin dioxygenase-like cupin family protein